MIISVDTEKAFDKIQQLFMIKTVNKLGIKGNFLSLIKNIYKNPTANIKLNGKILNGLLLRSGRGEGCSGNALASSSQHCTKSSPSVN